MLTPRLFAVKCRRANRSSQVTRPPYPFRLRTLSTTATMSMTTLKHIPTTPSVLASCICFRAARARLPPGRRSSSAFALLRARLPKIKPISGAQESKHARMPYTNGPLEAVMSSRSSLDRRRRGRGRSSSSSSSSSRRALGRRSAAGRGRAVTRSSCSSSSSSPTPGPARPRARRTDSYIQGNAGVCRQCYRSPSAICHIPDIL